MLIEKYPNKHPLLLLFHSKRFTLLEGLNSLQSLGLISDNCVTLEDIPWCDVLRVIEKADAGWTIGKRTE